jgi:hypothetical protein
MIRSRLRIFAVLLASAAAAGAASAQTGAPAGFVGAVEATHPIAFFRFETTSGHSEVGPETYKTVGGASVVTGAPIGVASDMALAFDGTDGYVATTVKGGIQTAGSMMAWVRLAILPANAPHILYVGGESESGNDFDIQFEGDNALHFYTAAGSNLMYAPKPSTLVNQWHMIVVTADFGSGTRAIYWDGAPVAKDAGGGTPNKTSAFSIGESTVFRGRYFNGAIDEAALWKRALTAGEVSAIYAATKTP